MGKHSRSAARVVLATPTLKEAEAAARARAKVPRTRKELAQRQREAKTESPREVRAKVKAGDERYLLARAQGPRALGSSVTTSTAGSRSPT